MEDEATKRATPHFQRGVKLYRDGNFTGALAEFEEAYRIKPGASSLRNVALSLKELFRYAEAAAALERMLDNHGAELDGPSRKKVRATITELQALVGSARLSIAPAGARVKLDGRAVNAVDLAKPIRLNVGEHTLVVEAEGFAPDSRTFRIAGGQKDVPVEVELRAVTGLVVVKAAHENDAIAVDGQAKAFGKWQGRVPPGRHFVQVYRDGAQPFESVFVIDVGQTHRVNSPTLEGADGDEIDVGSGLPGAPPERTQKFRGWYAMAATGVLIPSGEPDGHAHGGNTDATGGFFGARGGYRIWNPVAVELMVQGSRLNIDNACVGLGQVNDCSSTVDRRDYDISSTRFGGNIRYMSSGKKIRFAATGGVGAVLHSVDLEVSQSGNFQGGSAKGVDPYFVLELGAQFNFGHVLLEGGIIVLLDGTDAIKGDFDGNVNEKLYPQDSLSSVGIVLKAGWSQWRPPRKK